MISFVKGDATDPTRSKDVVDIIAHVCNNIGAWGAGFTKAISRHWPEPEEQYRSCRPTLGHNQAVSVGVNLFVYNMVAQNGIGTNKRRLSYDALDECLENLAAYAVKHKAHIHMPRIGAGLAGGKWPIIEALIEHHLDGINVTIYDLK